MFKFLQPLLFLLFICASNISSARLEFDSQANKAEIYGPYIKYNVLKPPYSFGRYQIDLNDIRMTVGGQPTPETQEDIENENVFINILRNVFGSHKLNKN